jgi:hypothetical protein
MPEVEPEPDPPPVHDIVLDLRTRHATVDGCLRRKLGRRRISSVRPIGYRLEAKVEQRDVRV